MINRRKRIGFYLVVLVAAGFMLISLVSQQKSYQQLLLVKNAKGEAENINLLFDNRSEANLHPIANAVKQDRNNENQLAAPARPTCIIPAIEPDASWVPKTFKSFSCSDHPPNPVTIDNGSIFTPDESSNITCQYASVTFHTDFEMSSSSYYKQLPFGQSPCTEDVFHISCSKSEGNSSEIVFKALMRCIFKKPDVTVRVSKKVDDDSNSSETRLFDERLNILIFGLDSVSRVAWLEQMVKTTEFMTETLGGTIFEGYNIVGDGTTAAILGFTSGYMEEELHESRRGYRGAQRVDDFPLIWQQLADEAGYTTLWDEDGANFGTFHYRLMGFKQPPVDYYGRIFQLPLESEYPSGGCFGSLSTYDEMIGLFRQLFAIYPDPVRKFGFVFNSHFTHTSEGSGGQEAYTIDSLTADEFKFLYNAGYLNHTVVILLADHGSRYSGSRATHRGKISERLPFLSIAFPKWFQEKYPTQMAKLREAAKRLTTPFDLHATLLDIGGLKAKLGTPARGLSFFSDLPLGRTCADAGVSPHWCTCLSADDANSELALTDPLVEKSLRVFEDFVNNHLLASFVNDTCHWVTADRPFMAKRMSLNKDVATFVNTNDGHGRVPRFDTTLKSPEEYLQISFRSSPGDAEWEATFLHNLKTEKIEVTYKQISRTNRYGSAPKCIQDRFPYLRQFCYCTTQ